MTIGKLSKKAFLLVEDNPTNQIAYEDYLYATFPRKDYEIIKTDNLTDAVGYLSIPDINILAALIDNGFYLKPKDVRRIEGDFKEVGAGMLLIGYMRTGKFPVGSATSQKVTSELMKQYGDFSTRYKNIPIVWNSSSAEVGKIEAVKAAASGKAIDLSDPRYSDEDRIPATMIHIIDDHTAACDKFSNEAMVKYFQKQLANPTAVTGSRAPVAVPAARNNNQW